MKSIKEKAKETDRIVERISPNQSVVDMSGRKHFEAGANYALDAIEEFMKHNLVCSSNLKRFIEQLKSNQ